MSSSSQALKLETDVQICAFVKNVHDEVLKRHDEEKANALRGALKESRDGVLAAAETPAPRHFSRRLQTSGEATTVSDLLLCRPCGGSEEHTLPPVGGTTEAMQVDAVVGGASNAAMPMPRSTDNTLLPHVSVVFQNPRGQRWTTTRPAIPLEGAHEPRPTGTTPAFLKMHFAADDEKKLSHVPYFGEDDQEDVFSELYNTDDRERRVQFGAEYREREMCRVIEETLQLVDEKLGDDAAVSQKRIEVALATLLDIDPDLIHNRHLPSTPASPKKPPHKTAYLGVVDSYRLCFCRRCFTYDCNMHGCHKKPDVQLQAELAIEKERAGFWETVST